MQVCLLFKHDVQEKVFDSNCVEMGGEPFEMDLENSELQTNIRLVPIEKSHDGLFISGKAIIGVYYLNTMFKEKFLKVIALRWV